MMELFPSKSINEEELRATEAALADFYRKHAPALLPKVGSVLKTFEGRLPDLQERYKQKFGAEPVFRNSAAPAETTSTRPASFSNSTRPTRPASDRPRRRARTPAAAAGAVVARRPRRSF